MSMVALPAQIFSRKGLPQGYRLQSDRWGEAQALRLNLIKWQVTDRIDERNVD